MSETPAVPITLKAEQVLQATGGRLAAGRPDAVCRALSTDSRNLQPGCLFVALRGERFDGADFAQQAADAGATMIMMEEAALSAGKLPRPGQAALIAVADTLRALGDLAAWHRRRHPVRVVGITGSNGKTSTKQMTAAVLSVAGPLLATTGNLNNQIGLPLCLLGLQPQHRYAVLEMGMNHAGEIARLAEIAAPQLGVVTNVGPVHLEFFGSMENVARAKAELVEKLSAQDTAVLNADDPLVWKMRSQTPARCLTFGQYARADVRLCAARQHPAGEVEVDFEIRGRPLQVRLGRPGLHNAHNAAAALAVALAEGLELEQAAARLASVHWPDLRMEVVAAGAGKLLVDCYNANPKSVQSALETLKNLAGPAPACAVLGDMRELGEASVMLHQQVGRLVARLGYSGLCAFGPLAEHLARAAREEGLREVLHTEEIEEATAWARQKLQAGAWVLVKGSRAMRLERLVAELAPQHKQKMEA
jgi:UDP-N-acetylmuramoyl-tripeptide--D-alanyl-D-alanine ligase